MSTYYRYDAHCHIFTLKYALKEVKSLLHDILFFKYPWHEPQTKAMYSSSKGKLSELKEFLRQLYELIHAAGSTEEENLDFLQKEAAKAFPSENIRITPLMMDIFYMFAYPLDKDQDLQSLKSLKAIPVDEKIFKDSWNEILDDFSDYLLKKKKMLKATRGANTQITKTIQLIEEERDVKDIIENKSRKLKLSTSDGFYETSGFCFHLDNLMELVKKRKNELYPFIAIDPRRPGMIDALLSGSFFSGEAKFYGVKLYPRMGYHPECKPMDSVYKYCSDNNLPITFHCGKSGFPPSTEWKYAEFGNPINFEPVVKKYPKLKIDFAHLGSCSERHEWADTIIRLMNENENVYSDLSCYTNTEELMTVKKIWDENKKFRTRLMFGTDFDVMYFTDKVNMHLYYNNFKMIFNTDELKILMHDNPVNYMGISDNYTDT